MNVFNKLLFLSSKLKSRYIGIFRDMITLILNKVSPQVIVETFYGAKLIVNPIDPIGKSLMTAGIWENETTLFFKNFIKQGMRVVDIGANIGYYTILFSLLVGKKGEVYAFEPDDRYYNMLLKNIKMNNIANVVAENVAIYAYETVDYIYINPFGSSSITHNIPELKN
jgi:tRNA G26 N,N-dimethylase Trm1